MLALRREMDHRAVDVALEDDAVVTDAG